MLDSFFKGSYLIGLIAGAVIRTWYGQKYKQSRIENACTENPAVWLLMSLWGGGAAYVTCLRANVLAGLCGLSVANMGGRYGCGCLCRGIMVALAVTRGPWSQLVGHIGDKARTRADNPRCLPHYSASDVSCALAMVNRSSVVNTKLDCRLGRIGRLSSAVPAAGPT